MPSFSVAEAKTHLSKILDRVSKGEDIVLTRRGKPVAKLIPVERTLNILGTGKNDPNIDREVLARNEWWSPTPDDDLKDWCD